MPQHPGRQEQDRPQQREERLESDAHQAERQRNEPYEWPQDQREQGQRPAQDQQDEPANEGKNGRLRPSSERHERRILGGRHHAVEGFVRLRPVRPRLHRRVPARNIGKLRKIAVCDFADRDDSRAEVVGDRQLVAAQEFLLASEQVPIERAQPELRLVPSPLDLPKPGPRRCAACGAGRSADRRDRSRNRGRSRY